jgi:hypothetical protein
MMPRISGTELMFNFVQEYLDGVMERWMFDLDFNHYLMKYYPSMKRKNREMADGFYFYLVEEGFERAEHLDDGAHKTLIRKQWREFQAALRDGLW